MIRITPQTIVEHNGRRGVTVSDLFQCCLPEETPVVFEGERSFLGTLTKELKIIGPEKAVAEPKACGAGKGDDCCIYLTCGPKGFECERFSTMRYTLQARIMNAKRDPLEAFPNCQLKEIA